MSTKDLYSVLRRPIVTEKSTGLKDDHNQVVFQVRRDASKSEIRRSVERLLNVEVTGINTMIVRGKSKRLGRNVGRRPNWKKAIVSLAEGSEIEFFDEVAEFEDELEATEE